MDKNAYENYEYLPTNNDDVDGSQLLVVQEDGTFLCFNRPVQYVTQAEDVKEVLEGVQPCDVYDVTPQQLYIDGDNSSELISVSDQFIIQSGENNIYANNYLLQAGENAKEVSMEQDEVIQYKEVSESEETIVDNADVESADKNSDDHTEITLNDDQYQLLEQRGWILLESGEKTYLLDTSGLHDITADEKLILKLKLELQECTNEGEVSSSLKEDHENVVIKLENTQSADNADEDMVQYVIEDPGIIEEPEEIINYPSKEQEAENMITEEEEYLEEPELTPIEIEHDYVKLNSVKDSFIRKHNDSLRIKTKYSFKDIPPEIVLGKFNGKKLVASVVKIEKPMYNSSMKTKLGNNVKDFVQNVDQTYHSVLDDSKFEDLIREAVRGAVECSVKDVTGAEIVVGQLLRVPAFHDAVVERRLLITKVILIEDETGESYTQSHPSLVTGRALRDSSNNCQFRFMPDMLRRLAMFEEGQCDDVDLCGGESNDFDFLHIHVREIKGADGIIRISITLNKRHIPLHLFNDMKLRHPKTIFACSACASVYKTEEGLRMHQETECTLTDDSLTIDTDKTKVSYTIVNRTRGKQYVCNVCNTIFTKLANCQEHIKSRHLNRETIEISDDEKSSPQQARPSDDSNKAVGLFRCKMCNRAYLHAATLSKHIVSRHIKHIDVN